MAVEERQEETSSNVFYGMEGEMFVITKIMESNGEPGVMESIRLTMEEARRFADFINRWWV